MTEKEILDWQEQTGNREFYLMQVGKFLHAYGNGAFALARASGYRVIRKKRKEGFVLVCGFPVERFELVHGHIRSAGGELEKFEGSDKLYLFRGLDGTPDERMVCEQQPKVVLKPKTVESSTECHWLEKELLSFNLSLSTPLDAMNLIGSLQRRIKQEYKQGDAPESDVSMTERDVGIACESPAG